MNRHIRSQKKVRKLKLLRKKSRFQKFIDIISKANWEALIAICALIFSIMQNRVSDNRYYEQKESDKISDSTLHARDSTQLKLAFDNYKELVENNNKVNEKTSKEIKLREREFLNTIKYNSKTLESIIRLNDLYANANSPKLILSLKNLNVNIIRDYSKRSHPITGYSFNGWLSLRNTSRAFQIEYYSLKVAITTVAEKQIGESRINTITLNSGGQAYISPNDTTSISFSTHPVESHFNMILTKNPEHNFLIVQCEIYDGLGNKTTVGEVFRIWISPKDIIDYKPTRFIAGFNSELYSLHNDYIVQSLRKSIDKSKDLDLKYFKQFKYYTFK